MAKTPKELIENLSKTNLDVSDELERKIDEKMQADYIGGNFIFPLPYQINSTIFHELRIRYDDWEIEQKSELGRYCEREFFLIFIPRGAE